MDPVEGMDPVDRPTVRVLLIDGQDRTLLFHMHSDDGQVFWMSPGGGLEEGESFEEAAIRELGEETGWHSAKIGPFLGTRSHDVTWAGVHYLTHERWYLSRVESLVVNDADWTEDERTDVDAFRWWTLAELRATAERLVPVNLADVVEHVLTRGAPATPWALPV